jgi:hypothetical protein
MKTFFKTVLSSVAIAALLVATAPPVKAADYAVQKTFWSFAGTWTNGPTVVTNLNAAIDVTQVSDFALTLIASGTNAAGAAGGFSVVWETSLDGSNWPQDTNQISRSVGWFSIPAQSNNVKTVWVTNITVDSIGYWRIRHITNAANMNYTNMAVRGYVKPKRQNRDY